MTGLRATIVVVALSTIALVSGGCGSSAPLSKPDYAQKASEAIGAAAPATRRVGLDLVAKDRAVFGQDFGSAVKAIKNARAEIASLIPPPSVVKLHQRLLSILESQAADWAADGDAATKGDVSAFGMAQARLRRDNGALIALLQEFKAAGVDFPLN